MTIRLLVLLVAALSGCVARPWTTRLLAPCSVASGEAELDRERSYHAALLALDTRGYAITRQRPVNTIDAQYRAVSRKLSPE
ncbi:MAG: hypothetical protein RL385_91 [Pseudomonadota bacterium]|jgi:hypothetical protein